VLPSNIQEASSVIVAAESSSSRDADSIEFDGSKSLATPAVRKIAKERGLDLTRLIGSGPKGRILKEDVLRLQGGTERNQNQPPPRVPTNQSISPTFNQPTFSQPAKGADSLQMNGPSSGIDKKVPIRGVQRLMVASMNAAAEVCLCLCLYTYIPTRGLHYNYIFMQVQHLTLGEEIIFDKMIALKRDLSLLLKSQSQSQQPSSNGNGKISFLPLLIKAASLSLRRHPTLNATVNKEATEMILHHNHNIGIAMDTPKGLIVPVIERVQDKSIFEIANDLVKLQVRLLSFPILSHFTSLHFTADS